MRLNVGDIVVSTEVRYHADVTAFGCEPGQMAQCPPAFIADPKLIASKSVLNRKLYCSWFNLVVMTFINGAEPLARTVAFPDVAARNGIHRDWSCCHQFNTPFVVVRAISMGDKESVSFDEFYLLLQNNRA